MPLSITIPVNFLPHIAGRYAKLGASTHTAELAESASGNLHRKNDEQQEQNQAEQIRPSVSHESRERRTNSRYGAS